MMLFKLLASALLLPPTSSFLSPQLQQTTFRPPTSLFLTPVHIASPNEVLAAFSHPNAVILDVRSQPEIDSQGLLQTYGRAWVQTGCTPMECPSLPGAAHTLFPNKHHPIIVHCSSGGRAAKAKEVLDALGYTKVVNAGSFDELGYLQTAAERMSQFDNSQHSPPAASLSQGSYMNQPNSGGGFFIDTGPVHSPSAFNPEDYKNDIIEPMVGADNVGKKTNGMGANNIIDVTLVEDESDEERDVPVAERSNGQENEPVIGSNAGWGFGGKAAPRTTMDLNVHEDFIPSRSNDNDSYSYAASARTQDALRRGFQDRLVDNIDIGSDQMHPPIMDTTIDTGSDQIEPDDGPRGMHQPIQPQGVVSIDSSLDDSNQHHGQQIKMPEIKPLADDSFMGHQEGDNDHRNYQMHTTTTEDPTITPDLKPLGDDSFMGVQEGDNDHPHYHMHSPTEEDAVTPEESNYQTPNPNTDSFMGVQEGDNDHRHYQIHNPTEDMMPTPQESNHYQMPNPKPDLKPLGDDAFMDVTAADNNHHYQMPTGNSRPQSIKRTDAPVNQAPPTTSNKHQQTWDATTMPEILKPLGDDLFHYQEPAPTHHENNNKRHADARDDLLKPLGEDLVQNREPFEDPNVHHHEPLGEQQPNQDQLENPSNDYNTAWDNGDLIGEDLFVEPPPQDNKDRYPMPNNAMGEEDILGDDYEQAFRDLQGIPQGNHHHDYQQMSNNEMPPIKAQKISSPRDDTQSLPKFSQNNNNGRPTRKENGSTRRNIDPTVRPVETSTAPQSTRTMPDPRSTVASNPPNGVYQDTPVDPTVRPVETDGPQSTRTMPDPRNTVARNPPNGLHQDAPINIDPTVRPVQTKFTAPHSRPLHDDSSRTPIDPTVRPVQTGTAPRSSRPRHDDSPRTPIDPTVRPVQTSTAPRSRPLHDDSSPTLKSGARDGMRIDPTCHPVGLEGGIPYQEYNNGWESTDYSTVEEEPPRVFSVEDVHSNHDAYRDPWSEPVPTTVEPPFVEHDDIQEEIAHALHTKPDEMDMESSIDPTVIPVTAGERPGMNAPDDIDRYFSGSNSQTGKHWAP